MQYDCRRSSVAGVAPTNRGVPTVTHVYQRSYGRRIPIESSMCTALVAAAAVASLTRALRARALATGNRAIAPSRPTLVTRIEKRTSRMVTARLRRRTVGSGQWAVGGILELAKGPRLPTVH